MQKAECRQESQFAQPGSRHEPSAALLRWPKQRPHQNPESVKAKGAAKLQKLYTLALRLSCRVHDLSFVAVKNKT